MDINKLVRDSYKNSAVSIVSEDLGETTPDYSLRHVEALEQIAKNSLDRLKVAEQNLEALREISDRLERRVKVAEEDSKTAARHSRIAIAVSVLTLLCQFIPQITGIISQWIK